MMNTDFIAIVIIILRLEKSKMGVCSIIFY